MSEWGGGHNDTLKVLLEDYEREHKWIQMFIQKQIRKVLMKKIHEHFSSAVITIWMYFLKPPFARANVTNVSLQGMESDIVS